jgi:GH15 family glucan-1,4-alpha-glucosidase
VSARPEDHYPAIDDYALVGDTRTGALVSRQGSVDWLCLPDFDGPPLLSAVLDRLNGGRLLVGPSAGIETVERRYVGPSAVLETRFHTALGILKITDLMPMPPDGREVLQPERELLRILEVERGEVEVSLVYAPRPDYGHALPRLHHQGALGWTLMRGACLYRLRTDLDAELCGTTRVEGHEVLRAGERRAVSLSFCRRDLGIVPGLDSECDAKREQTLAWWSSWWRSCNYDGPYHVHVMRSAVVLRMLTFSQSGAVLAAATTSLPEVMGGSRNWDYRYCWLRDASFLLRSFIGLHMLEETESFFDWLLHATRQTRPCLKPLYTVYGRTDNLTERTLPQFEGYRGSGPVRVGNAANHQLQLDVYGSVVLAAHQFVTAGGTLDQAEKRELCAFGEQVCASWRQPDNGIWEMRGPRKHMTYSKVMCWAALDRLLDLHRQGILVVPEERFRKEAEALQDAVLGNAWNERLEAFSGAFGHDFLDASVLLMPALGIIDADDPRMRRTFERMSERLETGGLWYRYETHADGWHSREGAFLACSFWAVEYLARRGDVDEARRRLEALLRRGSDVGLYAEEFDPEAGHALGNFPQALSHVGLINAVLTLKGAEQRLQQAPAATEVG